ncbi:MAG: phosphate ABC transporter permease subunit PstC [Puniceicoccaceae bacterium]|nr:phosphate ABC transporter permease subunit PstC [Puniceicoccaceae bacterium]MBL6912084.1 phosphate ABC transporter permease subunit PstC [Puniceicoccaceae bacterium]
MTSDPSQPDRPKPAFSKRRALFLGQDSDSIVKKLFGSSAMVAILVLGLITIFLFKEGAGFLQLYHKSLQEYRLSGLEYVDILKEKREGYTSLTRYLNDVKADWINALRAEGLPQSEINKKVMSPEAKAFFFGYMRAGGELRSFVKKKMDLAIAARDQHTTNENLRETLKNYTQRIKAVGDLDYTFTEEDRDKFALRLREFSRENTTGDQTALAYRTRADEVQNGDPLSAEDRETFILLLEDEYENIERTIRPIDFSETVLEVTADQNEYAELLERLEAKLTAVVASADTIDFNSPAIDERIARFKELNEAYYGEFDAHREKLAIWDTTASVSIWQALGAFLGGKDWVTASDQQDWYGLLPLLSGSLLISAIALFFAIPFGVGAAIYVNQIAGPTERNLIKPYIEFVSAIPSVVIGFFGVVVLGEAIRLLSQQDFMHWVPFFPVQERLNAFTAGCLLALMAIPTIFTLAEDAINNIPRHFKEASLAMGATQLQTTMRVIVPTALSGIISAIMLGFGRVIGETMVVLLCAGNRIKIPDFTEGLGVFVEPVHTMTGIIAQEMGEVVHGSLHYRALFMVGIVLFFISLLINYSAQWVVKRYSKLGD